jgi:putative peptidoglycan lipid II flippase
VGATTPPPERGGELGSARAAWWVGAGIFLSRISGFVRDAVVAYYLGTSRATDVWSLGLRTPNIIQNLLGEGTLSASFIPVYAGLVEEGRDEEAGRFAGAALGLLAVAAYGLAILGMLAAPLLVPLVYPGIPPDYQRLLVTVIRIMLPMVATLVVSAWALGVLNTHRRFFVSYVAPVLWNAGIVGAAVTAGTLLGFAAAGRDRDLVLALAWGALGGSALVLLFQLPFVVGVLRHFRLSVSTRVTGMREAIRNLAPVVAARGVVNLSALLDGILAALLAMGAVTTLGRAQTLYVLPISLFGMAVAAAELPELSRRHMSDPAALAERVRGALERVGFFLVPSLAAYLVFGEVLVEALYQRGDFGTPDTRAVYVVLAAYALGLLASGRSRTLSSAFFAVRDTGTPARVAVVRVLVSLAVGVPLMFPLDRIGVGELRYGAAGLALGASVGAWVEYVLLRRALSVRLGEHGPRWGHTLRLFAAALVASGAALGERAWFEEGLRTAVPAGWQGVVAAAGTALTFGVAYLVAARAFGVGRGLRSLLGR